MNFQAIQKNKEDKYSLYDMKDAFIRNESDALIKGKWAMELKGVDENDGLIQLLFATSMVGKRTSDAIQGFEGGMNERLTLLEAQNEDLKKQLSTANENSRYAALNTKKILALVEPRFKNLDCKKSWQNSSKVLRFVEKSSARLESNEGVSKLILAGIGLVIVLEVLKWF